jgi:predicted metalloprotease with PDZ domain
MSLRLTIASLVIVPAAIAAAQNSSPAAPAPTPAITIGIAVDGTDAPRKILHAHLTIPAQPGPLTLVYPKWIPGEHGPTGPIDNFAGIKFFSNGQLVRWQRDPVDMYAFHLDVPAGTSQLTADVDFLATAAASGFSAGASTSANLLLLSWNELILYPQGMNASAVQMQPAIKLPGDWQFGTALTRIGTSTDGYTTFQPVPLEMLVDSPVLAGKYFKEIPLAPDVTPRHYLDLAADGPEDLAISNGMVAAFSNLVRETGVLYASRHYYSYHFLVTLSDQVAHFGLEHHQSSDDRVGEKTFLDDNLTLLSADLLPHEFTHSWNGKYRRPDGLATPNYQEPMKGNLLWVYEGLTQYLGDVLAARSGIETADQYRMYLASSAASMDNRPGRTWRDLQDTATAAQTLYSANGQWDNWRRNVDYYPEGELVWLDVDTTIRRLSGGKKSLNDFCARFEGYGGNTGPMVVPYNFEDVVANLNAIQPNDWATFLRDRLTSLSPHAPLEGLTQGGYELQYTADMNDYERAAEAESRSVNAWYSLGMRVGSDGELSDVLYGGLADKAGFGPGMTIIAVNGRHYSGELLHSAIRDSLNTTTPIEFIVENTGYFKVLRINYHSGERYPWLVKTKDAPDVLGQILAPMVPRPAAKDAK